MTVSGHFAYTNDDNMMSYKHRNEVANLDATSAAKAYVATQIELDRALERLINELTNAGKLDNTVIVLLADHYPYELDLASINSLSSYEREETVTVNHNNLIIWNSKLEDMHIEKPCMSSDVLPTVYNLFGIDYDSRLFTGRDILSDSFGIAIMRNHSWITDKGTYYANGGRFVGNQEELPEGYIDNINTLVNNRLNIAKLIVETNYYNYLFN
jgi:phosphoglycerol transferase MdoB-like AlkP superfamily enzyme